MENTIKTDKQILVDWYFQMLANDLGPHAEIFPTMSAVGQPGSIDDNFVQKRLAFKSQM